MGKRLKAKSKVINVKRLGKSESHIRKDERQIILCKLQKMMKEFYDENCDPVNSDCKLLQTENKRRAFPKREITHIKTSRNEDVAHNNEYICYRCQHFSRVPRNLSRSFCERMPSFIGRCEIELSFVQAMVWLKSAIARVPQISIEQLQRVFDKQWNIRDNGNYNCNRKNDAFIDEIYERLRCCTDKFKDLSICEEEDIDTLVTSSSLNIFNSSHNVTPRRKIYKSYTGPGEGTRDETKLSFVPTYHINLNESPIETSIPEGCRITVNKEGETFLSRSCIIPEITDVEFFSCSSSMFSVLEHENEDFESENDARGLLQASLRKNDIERANKEISRNKKNIFLSRETREYTNVSNKCKSVLSMKKQYVESTPHLEYNFDEKCFTPMASQYNLTEALASGDDTPGSLLETRINISQDSNIPNDNGFEFEGDKKNHCIRINDIATGNIEYDSAYDTLRIDVFNRDNAVTVESTADNLTMPDNYIAHRYELRPRDKKAIAKCEEVTASPSVIQGTKNFSKTQTTSKRQFSSKKNKSGRSEKKPPKKGKTNRDDTISAKWLSFTLESLNVENVILASVKLILSTICNKRVAEEYAILSYWKNTLREEAVNAVLNASDIFEIEKKPNICIKEIVTAIVKTLDEMMTRCIKLNEISVWILRIQIILELCNSLPVCIHIVNHLIQKLKSFESTLIDTMDIQQNSFVIMNQLHLLFYALNIVLQKYRTIVPNDKKCQSAENALSHVVDLWKIHYVNEQLEDAGLKDLYDAEKRWINTLENFTATSIKYFVQFAEKSASLVQVLISQSRV